MSKTKKANPRDIQILDRKISDLQSEIKEQRERLDLLYTRLRVFEGKRARLLRK